MASTMDFQFLPDTLIPGKELIVSFFDDLNSIPLLNVEYVFNWTVGLYLCFFASAAIFSVLPIFKKNPFVAAYNTAALIPVFVLSIEGLAFMSLSTPESTPERIYENNPVSSRICMIQMAYQVKFVQMVCTNLMVYTGLQDLCDWERFYCWSTFVVGSHDWTPRSDLDLSASESHTLLPLSRRVLRWANRDIQYSIDLHGLFQSLPRSTRDSTFCT